MTQVAAQIMDSAVPRLGNGHKFRFDQVRDAWVLLGPERLFLPDEHAVEILKLVDGVRSVEAIAADLATRFAAPVEAIRADVEAMLADLAARGAVRL
jgi:pyrroloquinoline quinone biosynthesis protein D